jgi:hypothetical protein
LIDGPNQRKSYQKQIQHLKDFYNKTNITTQR